MQKEGAELGKAGYAEETDFQPTFLELFALSIHSKGLSTFRKFDIRIGRGQEEASGKTTGI